MWRHYLDFPLGTFLGRKVSNQNRLGTRLAGLGHHLSRYTERDLGATVTDPTSADGYEVFLSALPSPFSTLAPHCS